MAAVNYEYYLSGYLMGRDATLEQSEFPYWEKQARVEVNARTFGKVEQMTSLPEPVKDCICSIAEIMKKADKARNMSLETGASGPMTSYTNDGESGSFANDSNSIVTVEGERQMIRKTIERYLATTGLLYSAVPMIGW